MTFKTTVEKSIKSITFFAIGCILFLQLLIRNGDIMTTYYVSKSGNNSNTGTSSSPLQSIQKAIDKASAGDTILIKAGTYDRVKVYNKNGTQSKPITIAAAPGDEEKVIISGGGYGYDHGGSLAVSIKNSSNIIVKNLNLTTALVGIGTADSKNITLQSNKIYDIGQAGIKISDDSSHVDILNNTISDTGKRVGRWGEGIYLGKGGKSGDRVSNVLIKGNDISQTISEAIDIKPYVSDVIVEDNLIHDMKVEHSGAVVIGLEQSNYSGGRDFSNADNIVIRNNKIWNISAANGKDGHAINASSSTTIYNNVIWNYQNRGIYIHRALNNHDFKVYHNTVYPGDKFSSTSDDIYFSKKNSSSNAEVDIQNNIGYEGGNNISGTKELFVDAKNGNFKLRSNSPAVDAGIKLSEVKTDLAGSARIQGGAPDLGAYEYGSSPSTKDNPPALPKNNPSTPIEDKSPALPKDNPSTLIEDKSPALPKDNLARIQGGLQVLYTFDAGKGNTVFDVSKVGNPINLTIDNPQNVSWGDGTLTVDASTLISSQNSATKLNQAIAQSNELTIEAWVISEDEAQSGPARMVTLSDNISNRNFTLGQRNDTYDVRLRTTTTGNNGNKVSLSTPTGVVDEDELTHVVYTRDTNGKANLYVDNQLVASDKIAGNSSNWNLDYELGLANELNGDRPWTGTYDLVAVYDRALGSKEVAQNFRYGSTTPTFTEKPSTPTKDKPARIQDGLNVLYTFDAGKGNTVFDVSKVGNPINLTIDNPQNVSWGDGTLTVDASTLISSQNSATKLNQAIAQSNELTIEAWVIAEDTAQSGPARMVTLSDDISNRNFTLGQRNDSYDVRLRTTVTGNNGNEPSLSTPTGVVDEDELTHIVYTRDTSGKANLYIDNELVTSEQIAGNSSNWDLNYELGLANELSGDRPWTGTYDLVAVYDRALGSEEVTQNFLYGSQVSVV